MKSPPMRSHGLSCQALASAMEVNETITEVYLDMKKGQLSDEGRQAQ